MSELIPIDEVVYFDAITTNPTTGAVSDADSTPTFDVYEEATDTGMLGATNLTKRTSLTGDYRGTFTASAANGFEAGKWYSIVVSATVNSIAGKCVAKNFRCAPAEAVAGVPVIDAKYLLGTIFSTPTVAGVPNVNAKTWNDLTTVALPLVPTVAGRTLDVSAGGEAGVDWANVGTPGSTVGLSATTVATVTITTTATNLTTNNDKTGYGLSAAAVQAIWDALTSALTTVGSIGKLLVTNIDALISSRATPTNITAGTITTVTNLTNAPTAGDLTATMKTSVTTAASASTPALSSAGVQAIWDKATSLLTTSGSIGKWILDKLDVVLSSVQTAVLAKLPSALTGAGNMKSDAWAINGSTTAAAQLSTHWAVIVSGSISSALPTTTSFNGDSGLSTTVNKYQYEVMLMTSGANAGLCRRIASYTGSTTKTFSFTGDAWDTAPAQNDTFQILGRIL